MNNLRPEPRLALVVPCYNEEETLPDTLERLCALMAGLKDRHAISQDSFICCVDDGSVDDTWEILVKKHAESPVVRGIKFAGNAGHQNAVWAGMMQAYDWGADCCISLDADLQDDIGVIPQMLDAYRQGSEIVYGVRNNRETDTAFKRDTAHLFYALMKKLGVAIIPDHADYRLVGRAPMKALQSFEERNLFLRGIFPVLGFKTAKVYYGRLKRTAGVSKYPLLKQVALAWQGITSCSILPLRIAGVMSLLCMLVAMIIGVYCLISYITGDIVQGWTSLVAIILFLGSVQLFCLAMIGEYIGKIFTEVRHRPRYIIEKYL